MILCDFDGVVNAYDRNHSPTVLEILGIPCDPSYLQEKVEAEDGTYLITYRQSVVDWINGIPEGEFFWLTTWERFSRNFTALGINPRPYLSAPVSDLRDRNWKAEVGYDFTAQHDEVVWIDDQWVDLDRIIGDRPPLENLTKVCPNPIDGLTDKQLEELWT